MKKIVLLFVFALPFIGNAQNNTLSDVEKKEGWTLLYDGKTNKGWHTYHQKEAGVAWEAKGGALYLNKDNKEGRGDLVTDGEFENYELKLQWKIEKCGNSGIIFNSIESDKYGYSFLTGPEMQVLDNECHEDAKIIKHRAGDLYDLISCKRETVRPAGEWNDVRIVSKNAHYEFWLNGEKVVEFTMHTPEWDTMVKGSKFKSMPDFGKATKGHIVLQDHGNGVWYRNIKIKTL
jgi:cytochrome c